MPQFKERNIIDINVRIEYLQSIRHNCYIMKDKKKICFVVAMSGSATAFLKEHIKALLNEDFKVHLVANFKNEEDANQFDDVICHSVPIERKINIWSDFMALLKLIKVFKEEGFYSVHSVTPKAGLLTAIAGWIVHIPHRIHIFTGQVWCTMPPSAKRSLLISLDKLIAQLDTNLLADSKSQRQYLIGHSVLTNKNSFVIGEGSICGVNLDRFAPNPEIGRKIRMQNNISDDKVVFMLLGRMNHDKGIGELFEAFNHLIIECSKAYLVLVGMDEEGYDKRICEYPNIVRDVNYLFYGLTSEPQNLLQAADIFVLPTWREGFGSSVIEASCIGLPVIVSDTYGVMDAMVDNETGLRCHVGDAESLYYCMKRLYNEPTLRKLLGNNGRKRVMENFSSEVTSQAWVDFYKNL